MEKRVVEAVEDYVGNCAHVKVDIVVLESLLKPENLDVSPRHVLKYSTRRGSNNFVVSRRRWLESQEKWCTAREWAKRDMI